MTSDAVRKSGRWTKVQEDYMRKNYEKVPVEEMALYLEKNPATVRKYCREKLGMTEEAKLAISAKFDIQRSPIWADLSAQMTPEELKSFLYNWQNFMVQFKHDVYSTERMQLIEVCRIEVLLNRNMKKTYEADINFAKIQIQIEAEKAKGISRDEGKIANMEMLLSSIRMSQPEFTREYKDLLQRKESLVKSVAGSREQRITRIADNKATINSWMINLIENDELRRQMGIELTKGNLAMLKEYERLSDYNTFCDGVERIITSCDTVILDDLQEENNE